MSTLQIEKRVRIVADTDPTSPREWDNVGTMACWHRNYNLGDVQPSEDSREYLQSLAVEACPRLGEIIDRWDTCASYDRLTEQGDPDANRTIDAHLKGLVTAVLDKYYVILPLYLYDHSGITISTGRFSCPWDSGQVGYIYCTVEKAIRECGSVENATKCLEGEVETYDQYLTGNVYGFVIESRYVDPDSDDDDGDEWEHVDSCWGFFGDDVDQNGMIDAVPEELHEQLRQADPEFPTSW